MTNVAAEYRQSSWVFHDWLRVYGHYEHAMILFGEGNSVRSEGGNELEGDVFLSKFLEANFLLGFEILFLRLELSIFSFELVQLSLPNQSLPSLVLECGHQLQHLVGKGVHEFDFGGVRELCANGEEMLGILSVLEDELDHLIHLLLPLLSAFSNLFRCEAY